MGFGKLFLGSWESCFGSICTNPSVFLFSQCKAEAWTRADIVVTGLFLTLFSHMVKALNLILNTQLFLQTIKKNTLKLNFLSEHLWILHSSVVILLTPYT